MFILASALIVAMRTALFCWCLTPFPQRLLPVITRVALLLLFMLCNYVLDFSYKAQIFIDAAILRCIVSMLFVAIWLDVGKRCAAFVGLAVAVSCEAARSSVLWFVLEMIDLSIPLFETMQVLRILVELAGAFVAIAPLWVIRRYVPALSDHDMTVAYLLALAQPLAIILVVNLWKLPEVDGRSPMLDFAPTLVVVVADLSAVAAVSLIVFAMATRKRDTDAMQLENIIKVQHEALLARENSEEAFARVMHDIKNHLTCINELTDECLVEEHVNGMRQELGALERYQYTGNPTLDIILNEKVRQARSIGADLQVLMDFTGGEFLKSADVCALFGNALDNAIQAVKDIKEADRRIIVIKSAPMASHLVVRVSNCFDCEPVRQNGVFMSTKRGGSLPGLGLRSIEHSLSKYGGTMETIVEDGWFSLLMSIPLQRDTTKEGHRKTSCVR